MTKMTKDEEKKLVKEVEAMVLVLLGAAGAGPGSMLTVATMILIDYMAASGMTLPRVLAAFEATGESLEKRVAERRAELEKMRTEHGLPKCDCPDCTAQTQAVH